VTFHNKLRAARDLDILTKVLFKGIKAGAGAFNSAEFKQFWDMYAPE
jgi:hypothetical protein